MLELVVEDFNLDSFKKSVIDSTHLLTSQEKSHLKYLYEYLSEIKCKTIVSEIPYVDGDYLDDYSFYYVKCFKEYRKKCKRIHFFSMKFLSSELEDYLNNKNNIPITKDKLQGNYLGFSVIRPLPDAIIGRTVLKTYPSAGRRYFPCIREYKVGFLGTKLIIESLAFQEQDTVLAACATTALWSALHKTTELFDSKLLTPTQITASASRLFLFGNRAFPSHGLNMVQMCQAIKEAGLEPEFRDFERITDFSGFINGYLQHGIPVILGLELQDPHCFSAQGLHAVTIAGYSINESSQKSGNAPIPLKAHAVDKYYVHDDQVGPFSRMELDDPVEPKKITTGWPCVCGCGGMLVVKPKTIFVPVYHKIRITFEDVVEIVSYFHELFEVVFNVDLVWNIYLCRVNDLKESFYNNYEISKSQIYKVLLHNYPRYIWRAVVSFEELDIIELVFDSTDIQRGMYLDDIIFYYDEVKNILGETIKNNIDELYLPNEYKNFFRKFFN